MKNVKISELKNNLSAIIAKLYSLGSITVYDRNTPVAVIYPFGGDVSEKEEMKWLYSLQKRGVLESKNHSLTNSFFKTAPVRLAKKVDVVKILIDERGDR